MTAHSCPPIAPPFGNVPPAARSARPAEDSLHPAAKVTASQATIVETVPAVTVADPQPKEAGSLIGRLWRAYRQKRAEAVLRNLAHELDAHMLKDVGAPQWLVNQTTLEQSLKRITRIETLRW
ncbi:hypothetical protein [Achromobacter sp. NCFB-sbj8-Ac1-l]|uniref:hypothetical protein n=1 Tax=unclassified Achromobacter TaxID=2626865 RepID=UPI004046A4B4